MANRNNFVTNWWHGVQQDSVSWGSLILWISGIVMLVLILTTYSTSTI